MTLKYNNLSEAADFFLPTPTEEPIAGLQKLLRQTFMSGACATLRLIEHAGYELDDIRNDLLQETNMKEENPTETENREIIREALASMKIAHKSREERKTNEK